jgi:hypothetical protein
MNLREGDEVSAVALVVETEADNAAGNGDVPEDGDAGAVVAVEAVGEHEIEPSDDGDTPEEEPTD